jgi:hypothetical protein
VRSRSLLVAGGLLVLTAVLILVFVLRLSRTEGAKVKLASDVFRVGSARHFAPEIARHGPLLFQDPLARGTGRNIYVQHLGADPSTGWIAVAAPRGTSCDVSWSGRSFVDCHGDHGPDGHALASYPVTVALGVVTVDLRTG